MCVTIYVYLFLVINLTLGSFTFRSIRFPTCQHILFYKKANIPLIWTFYDRYDYDVLSIVTFASNQDLGITYQIQPQISL